MDMAIFNPYQRHVPTILVLLVCILGANCTETDYYSSTPPTHARLGYNELSLESASFRKGAGVESIDGLSRKSLSVLYRGTRTTKKDLCDDICKCSNGTRFLAVKCDLNKHKEYIFGAKNFIPAQTTSLVVTLGPKASLRIESNFLKGTKVNRLAIIGNKTDWNSLEFRTNATTSSLAPNPEIEIENCHTLALRERSIGGDVKLTIKNCNDVIIFENALYSTKFFASIHNIKELIIYERAFYNSQGNLRIFRSNIDNLRRFDAILHLIAFYNCTIGNITGKTFDVIEIGAIIFENCRIKVINTEAVTEKLFSNNLKITGGHIGVIESQALFGNGVRDLVLANNQIDFIQSNAIKVTSVNAAITKNRILRMEQDWLHINDWTNVTVSDNTFGEYNLMKLDKLKNHSGKCIFERNLITRAMPGSLNFTEKSCRIREIAFDHVCKCLKYDNWLEELTSWDIRSESYCRIPETLQFCFNRSQINVLNYENEVCIESSDTLDCMKQHNWKIIDGEFIKPQEFEPRNKSYFVYIIIAASSLLVIVLVLSCFLCRRVRKTMAQNYEVNTNLSFTNRGRFSKDDIRVISQTMDAVKQNYSNETYNQLDYHVKRLLEVNAEEHELVQTVAAILQILNNCDNAGDRFVPFTNILDNLLQPTENNPPDPVYAEPQFLQPPGSCQQAPKGLTDMKHLYSEPQSLQQPLLRNEYATPVDRNEANPVYAEPIVNEKGNYIIAPYAAVNPKRMLRNTTANGFASQQPSTSQNLPDVLSSSSEKVPWTPVKRLESFATNPNFHINRSPTTNRRIPEYTISTKRRQPGPSRPDPDNSPMSAETGSNHSGGSDVTMNIDDLEYATPTYRS